MVLSDTLHESILLLSKQAPVSVPFTLFWLLLGKATFKSKLAESVSLNVDLLPYNQELIDWLIEQRACGKKIVLSTAADNKIAKAVAEHLALFDEVFASDGKTNNASLNKRCCSHMAAFLSPPTNT